MAKGGSQPDSQVVEQVSDPWEGSQGYLRDVMGQAQQLYRSNVGTQYYPFSNVVPFSNQTEDALQMQENIARGGNPFMQPAQSAVTEMMTPGGQFSHTPGQAIQDIAAGQMGPGSDIARQQFSDAAQGGMINEAVNGFGRFTGEGTNPYLQGMYDQAAERVRDNTAAMFSSAGRYGSVAHQDALSGQLSDMATQMYGQQYNQDMQRALAATGQQAQYGEAALNRRLQGAQNLLNQQAMEQGQTLAADQALRQATNDNAARTAQAIGMVPGLSALRYDDAQRLAQIGAAREGLADQQLADARARWDFQQQAPWQRLAQYSGLVSGMGSLGGTTNTYQPTTGRTSPLMGGLGGAATGAGLATAIGLTGGMAAIPIGLGALAGAFG